MRYTSMKRGGGGDGIKSEITVEIPSEYAMATRYGSCLSKEKIPISAVRASWFRGLIVAGTIPEYSKPREERPQIGSNSLAIATTPLVPGTVANGCGGFIVIPARVFPAVEYTRRTPKLAMRKV
jgi:hypothetical protein